MPYEQLEAFPPPERIANQARNISVWQITCPEVRVSANLQRSIDARGVLVPVFLRGTERDGYRIIDGRRRVAALVETIRRQGRTPQGLPDDDTIPAIIVDDATRSGTVAAMTLSANMVRTQNVIAELEAMETLMTQVAGLNSEEAIANRFGISRRMVRNRMRLRNLVAPLRSLLQAGSFSLQTAVMLAQRPHRDQFGVSERIASQPGFHPTPEWIRSEWRIEQESVVQTSMLDVEVADVLADIPDAASFAVADEIIVRLIQAIPDPQDSSDPSSVEDIIYRLNSVAELIAVMAGA
jgi:ParB/RepB/Spo0J family partition protein